MKLTLSSLVAIVVADIEIFLLLSEDQKTDNDKETFTREEIREQLSKTSLKVYAVLKKCDFDTINPIINRSGQIAYYSVKDETEIDSNNILGLE